MNIKNETETYFTINTANHSNRGKEWIEFAIEVLNHIENYTVPQYGDKGVDQVTGYTIKECMNQCKKYADRFGRNQREGQEELDFKKVAHYACIAFAKNREGAKE